MSLHVAYITLVLPLHAFSLRQLFIQTLLGLLVLLLVPGGPTMALRLLRMTCGHGNGLAWLLNDSADGDGLMDDSLDGSLNYSLAASLAASLNPPLMSLLINWDINIFSHLSTMENMYFARAHPLLHGKSL
jgi:hypothetical protein